MLNTALIDIAQEIIERDSESDHAIGIIRALVGEIHRLDQERKQLVDSAEQLEQSIK